jgi:biopolymer transport protein TolR
MAFAAGSSSTNCEINVTPLIDVLLVLLIIFMVITPTMPRGLESAIPQGKASGAASLPVVVRVLAVDSGNVARYFVGSREVARQDVDGALLDVLAKQSNRAVFVQADRSLSFDQIASVVGSARRAGASAVALMGAPAR